MTEQEARQLLTGTVVMWDNDPSHLGTVRKVASGSFYIDWEDGRRGWVDYQNAKRISVH